MLGALRIYKQMILKKKKKKKEKEKENGPESHYKFICNF